MTEETMLKLFQGTRDRYVLEAVQSRDRVPRRLSGKRRGLLIAAMIAIAALLVGCAAVIYFRLQDLKLGQAMPQSSVFQPEDKISLQGFAGSSGYRAARDWQEYLNSIDVFQEMESGNHYDAPEECDAYSCYSPAMQEKIDAICREHDLDLAGRMFHLEQEQDLPQYLGIQRITAQDLALPGRGYFYQSGNFHADCEISLSGDDAGTASCQYGYLQKRIFDGLALNVGDITAFDQWDYTAPDGTRLLLALSREKGLILADLPEAFIHVNVVDFSGQAELPQSRAFLEKVADAFLYKIPAPKVDVEAAIQREQQAILEWINPSTEESTTPPHWKSPADYGSYGDVMKDFADGSVYTHYALEPLPYAYNLAHFTVDTSRDVLMLGDGTGNVYLFYQWDGQKMHKAGPYTQVRLRQNGISQYYNQVEEDGSYTQTSFFAEDGTLVTRFLNIYGQWYQGETEWDEDMVPVTEGEFRAWQDSNALISDKFQWIPVGEFPAEP